MENYIKAHKHSSNHRDEILDSRICGCFYCLETFIPDEIEDWVDSGDKDSEINEEGQTVICPKCGIDSVIGDASGYSVKKNFLEKMHDYWFGDFNDE